MALLAPLLKTSAELAAKQIQYEKTQSLFADGERALELMGRAIRMAGYKKAKPSAARKSGHDQHQFDQFIEVQKNVGYRASDMLTVKHGLSDGIDYDCVGNVLTPDRTKHQLAMQGFALERQSAVAKGAKVNGDSLICQSLDRQGRIQNSMILNGVNALRVEELNVPSPSRIGSQRLYRIQLQMTDGQLIHLNLERTFATRNLL